MCQCLCAVCQKPMRGYYLLCADCASAYNGDEPWLVELKKMEKSRRNKEDKMIRDGVTVVPISMVPASVLEHGTKI